MPGQSGSKTCRREIPFSGDERGIPEHIVSCKLQQPADCLPENCGAEVTNVHLLGNVRGREVDHYSELAVDGRRTDAVDEKVCD